MYELILVYYILSNTYVYLNLFFTSLPHMFHMLTAEAKSGKQLSHEIHMLGKVTRLLHVADVQFCKAKIIQLIMI